MPTLNSHGIRNSYDFLRVLLACCHSLEIIRYWIEFCLSVCFLREQFAALSLE